ncbi:hypothetical protein AAHB34_16020 [Paenarthrobacter ureafaciens]
MTEQDTLQKIIFQSMRLNTQIDLKQDRRLEGSQLAWAGFAASSILNAGYRRQGPYDAIKEERERQEAKWGEQNHPDGTGPEGQFLGEPLQFGHLADRAKSITDNMARVGGLTYGDIFLEEVFEAMAESDPEKLRTELIQCAAVAVAWVEKIDRDAAKGATA